MAGVAKPSIVGLGVEVTPTILGSNLSSGSSVTGLFDGVQSNEWNTNKVGYWDSGYPSGYFYIELDISMKCNIWRSGTTTWSSYISPLIILKWNGTAYVDVSATYPQTITAKTETQWEKTISNLPKGRYKFATNGVSKRLDSEWYIEEVSVNKYLIRNENNHLFKVVGGSVTDLGTITPTESVFIANGMDTIPSLTELILTQIGKCKIIRWTDSSSATQTLNLQGDYKDKIIKLIPNYKLKMWTDDVAIATAKLNYTTTPYRPIDKLDNNFDIKCYVSN